MTRLDVLKQILDGVKETNVRLERLGRPHSGKPPATQPVERREKCQSETEFTLAADLLAVAVRELRDTVRQRVLWNTVEVHEKRITALEQRAR